MQHTFKKPMNNYLPVSIRQVFAILDEQSTAEEKVGFLSMSKSDFITMQHFGLGAWIRNTWIYGKEIEGFYGEPDDLSSELLGKYYDHLKRCFRAIDTNCH